MSSDSKQRCVRCNGKGKIILVHVEDDRQLTEALNTALNSHDWQLNKVVGEQVICQWCSGTGEQ